VRNAIAGPVTDVIRRLTEHPLFQETIAFNTKRAGDQNAAAKILLFEYEGKPVATKKLVLDQFAKGFTIDKKKINREHLELAARRVVDGLDYMYEVFIPSDVLLASAGTFPVYYWLVRNVTPLYRDEIRQFLVYFESERKSNRESQKSLNPSADVDLQYSRYDTLNRSTNDGLSHRGRYLILRAALSEFVADKWDTEDFPVFFDH
jgi:hypothetical protein